LYNLNNDPNERFNLNGQPLQLILIHKRTTMKVTVPEHSGCCRQSSFSKATPRKMALPADTMQRQARWLRA
jgi:hypothetical protein